jgi:hypothetical protein
MRLQFTGFDLADFFDAVLYAYIHNGTIYLFEPDSVFDEILDGVIDDILKHVAFQDRFAFGAELNGAMLANRDDAFRPCAGFDVVTFDVVGGHLFILELICYNRLYPLAYLSSALITNAKGQRLFVFKTRAV